MTEADTRVAGGDPAARDRRISGCFPVTVTSPLDPSQIDIGEEPAAEVLGEVLELLNETRSNKAPRSLEFLRWKYLENPDGAAVIWTVRARGTRKIVGFTACVPRRVLVSGVEQLAWVGADFSIDSAYRTLGPAVKLRRQASLQINAGRSALLFAHPNEKMAPVHARCGHRVLGAMVQMARPLQVAAKLRSRAGGAVLSRISAYGIDPLIRGFTRMVCPRSSAVRILPEPVFDASFDELFQRQAATIPVIGVRDSRYLNWRWNQRSCDKIQVLVDSDGTRLRGYAIISVEKDEILIRDMFPAASGATVDRLINAIVRLGMDERKVALRTYFLEGNPLIAHLRGRFFFPRMEPTEAYVYAPSDSSLYNLVTNVDSWFMTLADRDV
jgi:hypothetical protein